jgi:hypothetical protein
VLQWIESHPALLWSLGGASVAVFVASLLAMPAIVVRIPADYFAHDHRPPSRFAEQHRAVRLLLLITKNTLGGLLMLGGVAMLVLPGQGLLTLLVGFLLIDFPGKYRLEAWLVSRRVVHRPINWLRRRRDHPPLVIAPRHRRGANDPP